MKLSTLLLTTLSAAVLSGCEKSEIQPATDDTTQSSDVIQPANGNSPQEPYNCPACGMG